MRVGVEVCSNTFLPRLRSDLQVSEGLFNRNKWVLRMTGEDSEGSGTSDSLVKKESGP